MIFHMSGCWALLLILFNSSGLHPVQLEQEIGTRETLPASRNLASNDTATKLSQHVNKIPRAS
ncbi:hypothetical protein L798_04041 [Zootermopsis nevadensis]|uniref:Uncharacterized protein n=1 Tax=Zootermopsis nevadensis TaxID=136037 RepID=A0A067RKX5_ZOONE|nr:hypothetical protein L798_04041 [Zootermopsis nevadensis]